jgi:hypothetical protein
MMVYHMSTVFESTSKETIITIEGVVSSYRATPNGAAQAVVKARSESYICIWQIAPLHVEAQKTYMFSGRLSQAKGKIILVNPTVEAIKLVKRSSTAMKAAVLALVFVTASSIVATHRSTVQLTTNAHPVPTPTAKYSPNDCQTTTIPYASTTQLDPTLTGGQTRTSVPGANGSQKVCYPNGRTQPPITTVLTEPTDQVIVVGTKQS